MPSRRTPPPTSSPPSLRRRGWRTAARRVCLTVAFALALPLPTALTPLAEVPAALAGSREADKAFRQGDKALEKGDYEAAVRHFRTAYALSGETDPLALYSLALALAKAGRPEEAEPEWRRAATGLRTLHGAKGRIEHLWMGCYAASRAGDVGDARRCYQAFLDEPKSKRKKKLRDMATFRVELLAGLEERESRLAGKQLDLEATKAELATTQATLATTADKLRDSETALELAVKGVADLKGQLEAARAEVASLTSRLKAAEAQRDAAAAKAAAEGARADAAEALPGAPAGPTEGALQLSNPTGQRVWLEWALIAKTGPDGVPRVDALSFGPDDAGRGWWIGAGVTKRLGTGWLVVVELSDGSGGTYHRFGTPAQPVFAGPARASVPPAPARRTGAGRPSRRRTPPP